MVVVNVIVTALFGAGVFFTLVGAIGLLRFPDFYTRLHATGKCDTLGGGLIILGAMIYHLFQYPETLLVIAKLAFLIFFIFIANPTATHAIMKAAYKTGVKPWRLGEGRKGR
jgi:multicomponent Na+:H+ antiporter subunit G